MSLDEVWYLYSNGKQTYDQLSIQFCCSTKTIQRRLDKALIIKRKFFSGVAVVIMDDLFWSRFWRDGVHKQH